MSMFGTQSVKRPVTQPPEFLKDIEALNSTPKHEPNVISTVTNEPINDDDMEGGQPKISQSPGRSPLLRKVSSAQSKNLFVPMSQIQGKLHSREQLYRQLYYRAQMFLPPFSMCAMDYMQGILAGRIRVLHNFEVVQTRVPYANTITKKLVIDKVQDNTLIKRFLPRDPHR